MQILDRFCRTGDELERLGKDDAIKLFLPESIALADIGDYRGLMIAGVDINDF